MGESRQTIFSLKWLVCGQRLALFMRKDRDEFMDITAIKRLIDEGKVEYIKIGAPDIEGVWRGKRVAARFFLDSLADGFAQCDVLYGWDIAENVLPGLAFSNWERGFADLVMKPDLSTCALVPWEEKVASCICDMWTEHGEKV